MAISASPQSTKKTGIRVNSCTTAYVIVKVLYKHRICTYNFKFKKLNGRNYCSIFYYILL